MISVNLFFFWLVLSMYLVNYFSFLNSLMLLESMSLILFMLILFNCFFYFSLSFSLYYLVFIVCESALGLSILVKLIKFFGSSNFSNLTLGLF